MLGEAPIDSNLVPYALSADGHVVVGSDLAARRGFRWTEGDGFILLENPYNSRTSAKDISADGQTIVGRRYDPNWVRPNGIRGGYEVVLWESDSMTRPLGFSADHLSISDDGAVVAGTTYAISDLPAGVAVGFEPMLWTQERGVVGLGWPAELEVVDDRIAIETTAVNQDGSVVIGWGGDPADALGQGVIWSERFGMELFEQALIERHGLGAAINDWNLARPSDISPNGQFITGVGVNPDGLTEGWLIRLDRPFGIAIPEPSSLLLGGLAMLALCVLRRPA